jgi:hypothetical protein
MSKEDFMQNLSRNIALTFRVNEQERDLIHQGMKAAGIPNMRAYLLKMAVNGRIITVEMDSIKECNKLLRNIANNVNQIAARANATGNVYAADIAEIKARQGEIWEQQNKIVKLLAEIVEAA